MEQNKEYYAFISYKREDEKWAKWLQHKLEHYKLPSNLNGRTDLPREIRPIFRDTSELNPGNLPQQIYNALSASRHLIVICSPNSAKSEWVNKEVETFIAMGKQDCIIPFIIDGRPYADTPAEECFPPAIRNIPKEQELLGANITEMGRDAAAVKTVAQMFGVRFDTLWKRYEREQKRRRAFIIAAVALFILAVLGVAAYIWRQNNELLKSKAELQEAYDNLTTANQATEREKNRAVQAEQYLMTANDSIQYQYGIIEQTNANLVRTNDAKSLAQSRAAAEAAMKLIENGDAFSARKVALAALDISYTLEAERALRAAYYQNSGIINGHTDSVHSARFNSDGTLLVSASSDKTIRVWDVNTLKELYALKGHAAAVNEAVFSPDGRHIASASSDGTIRIWNTNSKACVKKLTDHNKPVKSVAYNADGTLLMTSSKNEVLVWNSSDYSVIKRFQSTDGEEINACFHPNGKDIVMFKGRTLQIEDIKSGDIKYTKHIPFYRNYKWLKDIGESPIRTFAVSPDRKNISYSDDLIVDTLYVINLNKDVIIPHKIESNGSIVSISYVDDRHIATSSIAGVINLLSIESSIRSKVQFKLKEHETNILSSSGNNLSAASTDGSIHLWNLFPIVHRVLLYGYREIFTSPTIIQGNRIFNSDYGTDTSSIIKEWDISTGKVVASIELPKNNSFAINSSKDCKLMAFSPAIYMGFSDPYFYKRHYKSNIYIYNLQSKKLNKVADSCAAVAFFPNNRLLACSRDGEVEFYDTKTFTFKKKLSCHTQYIYEIDVSPSNREMITASHDGTIKQWDIASGKCLSTLSQSNNLYAGKRFFKHVSYCPNGEYIAAVLENTVVFWSSKTGEQVRTLKGHIGEIVKYSFSSDGRWIVTTSVDGTIKVWDVQTGFLMCDLKPKYTRYFSTFSEDDQKIISVEAKDEVEIYDFPPLEKLINETREQFKDNPLTPEERKRFYLE